LLLHPGCCCAAAAAVAAATIQQAAAAAAASPDGGDLLHHISRGVQVDEALVDPESKHGTEPHGRSATASMYMEMSQHQFSI
jgi:hypothetical protein